MRIFVILSIIVYLLMGVCPLQSTQLACFELKCLNGGEVHNKDDSCYCQCPTEFSGLYCEYELESSIWPAGPYAIPMSIEGCPESQAHGWMKGYLKLQFNIPLNSTMLRNKTGYHYNEDFVNYFDDTKHDIITSVSLSDDNLGTPLDVDIMGPYTGSSFQLNFCYKREDHTLQETNSWPEGYYSIYSTKVTCPHGFEAYNYTLVMPSVMFWNSDGYIPYMTVQVIDDADVVVQFVICGKTKESNITEAGDSYLNSQWELGVFPFALLKYENRDCPKLDGYHTTEVTFSVRPASSSSHNIPQRNTFVDLEYCYYNPLYRHGTVDGSVRLQGEETAYEGRVELLHDGVWGSICSAAFGDNEARVVCRMLGFRTKYAIMRNQTENFEYGSNMAWSGRLNCTGNEASLAQCNQTSWTYRQCSGDLAGVICRADNGIKCLDFSDTLTLHTVDNSPVLMKVIDIPDGETSNMYLLDMAETVKVIGIKTIVNRRQLDTNSISSMIYISNDKWSFMYTGSEMSSTLQRWTRIQYGFLFVLKFERTKEGRYICMQLKVEQVNLPITNVSAIMCGMPQSCHRHLGMMDGGIEDFQIAASSWQTDYPPMEVRPLHNGWCASPTDSEPFIEIDLLTPIIVNGVIVTNWYNIIDGDQVTFQKTIVSMGITSFYISYGITRSVTHLYKQEKFFVTADPEPQTILFLQLFIARYIRLHPRGPLSEKGICLKFEILGCRRRGSISLACNKNNTSRRLVQSSKLFASFEDKVPQTSVNRSSCEEMCMMTDCGFVEYQSIPEEVCIISPKSTTNLYHLVNSRVQSNMSMLVCLIDDMDTYDNNALLYRSNFITLTSIVVITSHGYPFHYETNRDVYWLITLNSNHYINILFTNISLHIYEDSEEGNRGFRGFDGIGCTDLIMINRKVLNNIYTLAMFDNRFNGETLALPTYLKTIYMMFSTCSLHKKRIYTGHGFRAVLKKSRYKSCEYTQLDSYDGRRTCISKLGTMSSLSFLGFGDKIVNNEIWKVLPYFGRLIVLKMDDFYVRCDSETTFTYQTHDDKRRTFCNSNKPPAIYISSYYFEILFSYKLAPNQYFIEGFNAFFSHYKPDHATTGLTTYQTMSKMRMNWSPENDKYISYRVACSKTFNKCYYVYPAYAINWKTARDICLDRGFRLTSIRSKMEKYYVEYLVQAFVDTDNKLYSTFIGLSRHMDAGNRLLERWEDGSHLSYTAWDINEPSALKQCTYMVVSDLNNANTWKTIDCYDSSVLSNQSIYFVCDHKGLQEEVGVNRYNVSLSGPLETQATLYHCGSGEWIQKSDVCNIFAECIDKSDEQNCSNTDLDDTICTYDEFRCSTGKCIDITYVCDLYDNCGDGSDEFCDSVDCAADEFRCADGWCIPEYSRCDAQVDCLDKSDEVSCSVCNETKAFSCGGDSKCVPISVVCDKYPDCTQGTDELSCSVSLRSCSEWYEAGYKTNGTYTILGMEIECNFKENGKTVKVRTVMDNIDRYAAADDDYELASQYLAMPDNAVGFPDWDTCVLKMKMTCHPYIMLYADDPDFNSIYTNCLCKEWRIALSSYPGKMQIYPFVGSIFEKETTTFSLCSDEDIGDKMYVENEGNYSYALNSIVDRFDGVRWIDGPIQCETEININTNIFACSENIKDISTDKLCLYDHNVYGYIDGCRSLLHLQNCENFICPLDFMKCPGTFCLAIRFVCDGEKHCPGGEDEFDCWCNRGGSVAIVYHETKTGANENYISNFARKLLPLKSFLITITEKNVNKNSQMFTAKSEENNITLQVGISPFDTDYTVGIYENVKYSIHDKIHKQKRLSISSSALVNYLNDNVLTGDRKGVVYIQDSYSNSKQLLKFENIPKKDFRKKVYLYRVSLDNSLTKNVSRTNLSTFTDIKLKHWDTLGRIGATLLPDICQETGVAVCTNGYRCSKSKVCLPFKHVCDGYRHCFNGDDELYCDIKCPRNCLCLGYSVDCQDRQWNVSHLFQMSASTRSLDISHASNGTDIFMKMTRNLPFLVQLNVSRCSLSSISISRSVFKKMINLISLDLSYNIFKRINAYTFRDLTHLRELILYGNTELKYLESYAFYGLTSLEQLVITGSNLVHIHIDTFAGVRSSSLDLSRNKIQRIDNLAFNGLDAKVVDIQYNDINVFDTEIFAGILSLESLRTPSFKLCCLRPGYLDENSCTPFKDEFSSCDDLMRNSALQTLMWLVGASALVGNIASLVFRLAFDRKRLKLGYGIFVTNLAVADGMMGAYLMIISVADLVFRNRYIFMDEYWRNSGWCNMAGVLSTVSSEASVLFLCLITIDRFIAIKYPFGQIRLRAKSAMRASLLCWIIALFVAVMPFLHYDYFQNKFYTKSGVCIALPLTRDRPPGWLYSMVIFIGFNLITFVLIATGQILIYMEIKKSSKKFGNKTTRVRDLKVAKKLLFIVTTDFLCWVPVGIMGLMALGGHVISGDVYAWTAVLILPINSALNPFLYTLSSFVGNKKYTSGKKDPMSSTGNGYTGHMISSIWNNRFFIRDCEYNVDDYKMVPITEINNQSMPMELLNKLKIVIKLADQIAYLHQHRLHHGCLSASSVFIAYNEKAQEYEHIRLIMGPDVFTSADPHIDQSQMSGQKENVYSLGIIIRDLFVISLSGYPKGKHLMIR